jgi:hypothetical protein
MLYFFSCRCHFGFLARVYLSGCWRIPLQTWRLFTIFSQIPSFCLSECQLIVVSGLRSCNIYQPLSYKIGRKTGIYIQRERDNTECEYRRNYREVERGEIERDRNTGTDFLWDDIVQKERAETEQKCRDTRMIFFEVILYRNREGGIEQIEWETENDFL